MSTRGLAGFVLGAAVVAALATALYEFVEADYFRIKRIYVEGGLDGAALQEVTDAAAKNLHGTFFTADIDAVQQRIASLGWITSVRVNRVWPDALGIRVGRMGAVAIWEDGRLVAQDGRLFPGTDESIELLGNLPTFSGDSRFAKDAVANYPRIRDMVRPIKARVKALDISFRGSWKVTLEGEEFPALTIELGRVAGDETPLERLQLVVNNFYRITDIMRGFPERIDARYHNAFAASLPTQEGADFWTESRGAAKQGKDG